MLAAMSRESSSNAGDNQWKVGKIRALYKLNSPDKVRQAYDEFAESYDEFCSSLDYMGPAYTARVVSRYETNKEANILDVACGTGLLGDELHKLGYDHITGVDLSEAALAVLTKKTSYQKSIQAYLDPSSPLGFENGHFDAIMSCGSFLPSHLNEKCLPEMIRLVKKGGFIIITTREYLFHSEEGDMKLKSGLIKLTQDGVLIKIAHDEGWLYETEGDNKILGITLIYQVNH